MKKVRCAQCKKDLGNETTEQRNDRGKRICWPCWRKGKPAGPIYAIAG